MPRIAVGKGVSPMFGTGGAGGVAPVVVASSIENATPTQVDIVFNLNLNESSIPATTAFTLAGKTITNVALSGATVTLTVSVAYATGDVVTVNYTNPILTPLRGVTGGVVLSFAGQAVTNNVVTYAFTLTSTGNGTGVSTITLTVSADMLVTLGANAKFYSDAGGTADESATFTFVTGASTRYIKCTTGTATMTFADALRVTQLTWGSSTNAASLSGDISKLTALTFISCNSLNALSGNIGLITGLTSVTITNLTTISGSIAGLTGLTLLSVSGSNTISGSITALTALTYLSIVGNNTISGDLNPIVSDLTACVITGNNQMVDYTAGATWGNATITINPAVGYGYDSTEIDNMLIDMAASVALISKTITLTGSSAARTAASDAAVATLEGVGRTCTVVTNP